MEAQQTQIALPQELIREIDSVVGRRGRKAFLIDTARAELQRRQLLKFLQSSEPAWKDEDHPDLVEMGTEAWVRSLRRQSERSFPDPEADETPAA